MPKRFKGRLVNCLLLPTIGYNKIQPNLLISLLLSDDGLSGREKIESYLRKGRVPETKVRNLAIKIYEHVRKESLQNMHGSERGSKQMCETLANTITHPLDMMLYGKANK
jgi:hypothetical protein